ncbi:hypothetical protein K6U32_07725 [Vibrio diabolicus]|nr:hypothetical protein [Vibrio diabolicus]
MASFLFVGKEKIIAIENLYGLDSPPPLHRAVILISVIEAQRTIYLGHELANDASVLRCR